MELNEKMIGEIAGQLGISSGKKYGQRRSVLSVVKERRRAGERDTEDQAAAEGK